MSFSFNGLVPNANNDPADDVTSIQTNFASTQNLIIVDHQNFNFPNAGQHQQVTFSKIQGAPALVNGAVGEIFTNNTDASGQIFPFFTNATGTYQMISTPSGSSSNGSLLLPGGLIIKYGNATISTSTAFGTVSFNTAFPGHIYSIQLTLISARVNTSSNNTISVKGFGGSPSLSGFNWQFNGQSSGDWTGFYWIAVGN